MIQKENIINLNAKNIICNIRCITFIFIMKNNKKINAKKDNNNHKALILANLIQNITY